MNTMQYGFTLPELLVTVLVLAIISFMAIPFYHNTQAKQEAQLLPMKLQMHLQQAKQSAVLYHNNMVICSSTDKENCSDNAWSTGLMIFADLNQNRSREDNEPIIDSHLFQLRYGSLRWQGSLRSTTIVFQGDTGLPRGSIGSFYYCSQYDVPHRKIILNMMGIVRHETPSSC